MRKTKISLKMAFVFLNLIVIIFMLMLLLFNQYSIHQSTLRYQETISLYEELSTFYEEMEKADGSFRQYLYSANTQDELDYQKAITEAQNSLNYLKNAVSEDYQWRFVRLEYMLDSCKDISQGITSNNKQHLETYDDYIEQYQALENTSGQYYDYITQQMKQEKMELQAISTRMTLLSFCIEFLGILLIIFVSYMILHALMRPLFEIIRNLGDIEKGQYVFQDFHTSVKEIEMLSHALSNMAQGVSKTIAYEQEKGALSQKLLQIENESIRKDELLAQSELNRILNSVNPHFLFNTMNLIYKTALKEGSKETMELCEKTCDVYRYSLDYAKNTTDLYHEIEALKNYMYLSNKRYEDRIVFKLEVDEEIENIPMPSMLLQSLVDHAIIYHMDEMIRGGEIIASVTYEDGVHTITVSDNGKGMSAALLEKCMLTDFKNDEVKRMELYYVIRRIRMFFGSNANIFFDSMEGCGFEVTIVIDGGSKSCIDY